MRYPKITIASVIVILIVMTGLFFFLVSGTGSSDYNDNDQKNEDESYYQKILAGLPNKNVTFFPIDKGKGSFDIILQE